ncbi:gephyrin-like molybdotransferase Glp [Alkalicoccus chagannorensis]|uniref:molybdopterin molybdotransferase MoeA n=1 Tax=Alkalicoccus chagannorensis TaxID=427072 RepID=UPI0004105043|nr:gephyrin-like molybdotransferase Glp [Alkalicoccus chagannorensis]
MVEKRTPMQVEEAVSRVMKQAVPGKTERVELHQAHGRWLREAIQADAPVPPFDRSPYDGFAVRAEDTTQASKQEPVPLKVLETIGAGQVAEHGLDAGECIRIMTGAQMPAGADAVIMLELVQETSLDTITLQRPVQSCENVVIKGEETKQGDLLAEAGRPIHSGTAAALASFGYGSPLVSVKQRVGVLATGTELLEPHEELQPGKIRNSNAPMVCAQVKEAGAEPVYLGQLPDDFDSCYEHIKSALHEVDVLITTGGVSVGDFDFLPAIYEKLGADVMFNKVAMRPGSVTTAAVRENQMLFGLSGNPSACFVGFELFAGPFLKACAGAEMPYLKREKAVLQTDFPKPNPFTRFVRSKTSMADGRLQAAPAGLDKSQVVTSLVEADSLMMLPGGTRGFHAGDQVDVLLLRGSGSAAFAQAVKERDT